jgi:hypothetical protein
MDVTAVNAPRLATSSLRRDEGAASGGRKSTCECKDRALHVVAHLLRAKSGCSPAAVESSRAAALVLHPPLQW